MRAGRQERRPQRGNPSGRPGTSRHDVTSEASPRKTEGSAVMRETASLHSAANPPYLRYRGGMRMQQKTGKALAERPAAGGHGRGGGGSVYYSPSVPLPFLLTEVSSCSSYLPSRS